jgi:hypothetical protein
MLTSATDIVGRANQVFIVGQGLSNAGVEMLKKFHNGQGFKKLFV